MRHVDPASSIVDSGYLFGFLQHEAQYSAKFSSHKQVSVGVNADQKASCLLDLLGEVF